MITEELILTDDFCAHYHISVSFLEALNEMGIVQLVWVNETSYINPDQVQLLEQMTRLHVDLKISVGELDIIYHLLNKIKDLQGEVTHLRKKINFFET